jgi:outer membrane protein assembly factor BamB
VKTIPLKRTILLLAACVAATATASHATSPAEAPRPTLAVGMLDDPGFSELGCRGEEIETPQIHHLARHGIRGGVMVHAGCDDGLAAARLAEEAGFLVHGLARDRNRLETIREAIRARGLSGRVSVAAWDGGRLPYADGMVNVLLVSDEGVHLPPGEIDRVLAPLGMAHVRREGDVTTYRKPWPDDIDQWTHARYDATGNPASRDERVGPPRHLQWYASPRWNRGVKTSSLVSAGGRIFYILDDSRFGSGEPTWSLSARDAFNGVLLWRRELGAWSAAFGGKKVGPVQAHRKLVARGDRVYATLGESAPVSVLDAGTGEVLRVLPKTEHAEEMILSDDVLVVLVNPNTPADLRRGLREAKTIVALRADTGAILWRHAVEVILPLCLAADGRQVVYHDGTRLESLDLTTGRPLWTSAPTGQKVVHQESANPDRTGAEESTIWIAPQFAPTLMIYGDVVAFAGGKRLSVVSADDGKQLWRTGYPASNYSVPVDLFGFGGLLWGPDDAMNLWSPGTPRSDSLYFNGYDPRRGDLRKAIREGYGFIFQHHRCHQMKAVGGSILAARAGIEFLDTQTGRVQTHHWIRGSCHYGVMPANGILYVPPHDCACYVRAKLPGFFALRSSRADAAADVRLEDRLERGPAFNRTAAEENSVRHDDWPAYRRDAARSGRTVAAVSPDLEPKWETRLGGRLTSPVAAGGRVFLASTDAHRLAALDATDGRVLWERTLGARVDSPPTVHRGLVLCGCRDGWVYALRAADGTLAWRFRAAPHERWIVSQEQLESAWPLAGSVLVVNDVLYAVAGRSSYLDGGLHFYGLEPDTGEMRFHKVLDSRAPDGSQVFDEDGIDGYLNDVPSSNGEVIFLRHQAFDLSGNRLDEAIAHLHGADGYLSDDSTSRLQWIYAPRYTSLHQGAFYDQRLSRTLFPSGRILVEDDRWIYGFGQNHYESPRPEVGGQWALFAAPKQSGVPEGLSATQYLQLARRGEAAVSFRWWRPIPLHASAMLQAGEVLFVAGPERSDSGSPPAPAGQAGATLLAVSAADGRTLGQVRLPGTPVWDGMAAARNALFVATRDGRVLCLAPRAADR